MVSLYLLLLATALAAFVSGVTLIELAINSWLAAAPPATVAASSDALPTIVATLSLIEAKPHLRPTTFMHRS